MKVVFFGATSGMGQALARRMADRGDRLFLLGRNTAELERAARALEQRGSPPPVGVAHCDLADAASFESALKRADEALQAFDTAVLTAAEFGSQEELEEDRKRCERLLTVDFVNTVLFCEAARERLLERGGGTLCVFSSVAGERARKPVVLYGAAKAGLSHYLEGLDHRYRAAGLRTICVKPGFVKTEMTADLKPPPFAGDPDAVARHVLRAIDRGTPVVFVPPVWRWIMAVIGALPRFMMRRIDF